MKKITIIALIIVMVISCSCKKDDNNYMKLISGETYISYSSIEGDTNSGDLIYEKWKSYKTKEYEYTGLKYQKKEELSQGKQVTVKGMGIINLKAKYDTSYYLAASNMCSEFEYNMDSYIVDLDEYKVRLEYYSGTNILDGMSVYRNDENQKGSTDLSEEEYIEIANNFLRENLPKELYEGYEVIFVGKSHDTNKYEVVYNRKIGDIKIGENLGFIIRKDGLITRYSSYGLGNYDINILKKINPNELNEIWEKMKTEIAPGNEEKLINPTVLMSKEGKIYLSCSYLSTDTNMIYFYKELKLE